MRAGLSTIAVALGLTAAHAADWPQWRGPMRTGLAPVGGPALTNLSATPRVVWRLTIGGGFSSPVVADGKVVYLDAQDGQETAHVLDAATGRELWRTNYDEVFEDEWGPGPRSTPILDDDRLYVQSCRGEFRCLSLADGSTRWRTSFERDFGVKFLGSGSDDGVARRRGNNGCGVIDGDRIFVPVGATDGASIVCFDKRTGHVLWKAGSDEAAYSSLVVGTLAGRLQVVALTAKALLGVDVNDGRVLWRVPIKTVAKRHAVTPIIFGDDVIVSSFSAGMICTRFSGAGDALRARGVWTNSTLRVNLSTPLLVGEHLFLHAPMKEFACADARTGKKLWSKPGFAQTYSALLGLGQNLLVLTDYGELRLLAADSRKYVELGRAQICGETWSHPAYADGRLYVREGLTAGWKLQCLDVLP
jgi:outer membrane protein assembly factor BamB